MEYVQLTLSDWMEMKDKIRRELQGVKQSFVRIGYALRKIEDGKYYEHHHGEPLHGHQPGVLH